MKNFIYALRNIYQPSTAIIIREGTEDFYVEQMQFNAAGRLCKPRPMPLDQLAELGARLVAQGRKSTAYLPATLIPLSVLHIGEGSAIWYTPAAIRPLHFIDGLNIESRNYPVPALLWSASGNRLRIFALTGQEPPDLDTQLYHAPFLNVSDEGNVCMGNAGIDLEACANLQKTMDAWERHFFGSLFSHSNRKAGPDPTTIWQSIAADATSFPPAKLQLTRFTLNQLL
ncbi:hypothetical protein [Chitinophaga barathri]|uniref:PRTRC system protein B n=1 Tax=Chitinophaga barathri TaxID=1647451 RepID=A0A3N4MGA7_9BACT|nr:hypothetical protein [Chitinophaga barathri]RPD43072.1 hypothetical protein EG028_01915 [Chitinophaga barathri]